MQKHEEDLAARINGNNLQPLAGASVTVTSNATGLRASLYQDDELTPIEQPLTTNDTGYYAFKAANGEYTLTFSGVRFDTFTRQLTLIDPDQIAGSATNIHFIASGTGAVSRNAEDKLREIKSIGDRGAVCDGVIDDSAAIQVAAAEGPFYVPRKTVKVDTAITGSYRWWSAGGDFNGANPLDAAYPAFGPGVLRGVSVGGNNAVIGIVRNTQPVNTVAFPTGVTGYGRTDNAGNTAFGLFGRADLYATGVATNEVNSFNFASAPSNNLPPDRTIGTAQKHPVALTVAAGGDFDSSIGIHVCREGGSPRKFLTAMYVSPDAATTYGLYIDANAASTHALGALIRHKTTVGAIQVQGVGTVSGNSAWMTYVDGAGAIRMSFKENGNLFLGAITDDNVSRLQVDRHIAIKDAGYGLRIKEGSNAKQGIATLSAGTVTVSNTSITATSRVFLTAQDNSTTGALRVSARTAGTSFAITSSNAGDSGVVAYEIFEPA